MSAGRPYIAGEVGPEQHQQRGALSRLFSTLRTQVVGNGPTRIATADLPSPQIIPARPMVSDPVVPGSTGGQSLPGRIRPLVGLNHDGEPGAANPVDYEIREHR